MAESCSRQLRAWSDYLQNSDIKGQRHLNERSRTEWTKRQQSEKSRQTFEAMMHDGMKKFPKDHPMRIDYERKHGPLD